MPRTTYVKKAQQRYETVPVIDPETGQPKRTPVINKRTGQQKVTKSGRPVTMVVTVADKSKPKPLLKCDYADCKHPGKEIQIGEPYKHITPKSGPYGGTQRNRHADCPPWQVWDYSYSRSAQVARAAYEMGGEIDSYEFSSYSDFEDLKESLVGQAQEQLDEQQEALDNMPEGLQDGSQAQEYVDALESWVSEIEGIDAPDEPEAEPVYKWFVKGPDAQSLDEDGYDEEDEAQRAMEVYLAENPEEDEDDWEVESEEVESDEESDEVDEDWVEEAKDVLREAVDSCEI